MNDSSAGGSSGETRRCPYCAEPIQPAATKCRHCGEWLRPPELPEAGATGRRAIPLEWGFIVGGAAMMLGAFLPWLHEQAGFISVDRNGFQLGQSLGFSLDGVWICIAGAIIALVGITELSETEYPRWLGWYTKSPVWLGCIGLIEAISIAGGNTSRGLVTYSVSYGLGLVVLGSAMAIIFGLTRWWKRRTARRAEDAIEPVYERG